MADDEKSCTAEDFAQTMAHLKTYMSTKVLDPGLTRSERKNIYRMSKRYILEGETLYQEGKGGRREVVTCSQRVAEILHQYHTTPMGGHSGITNTYKKVALHYVWKGMKADVEAKVSGCEVCGKLKSAGAQAAAPDPIVTTEAQELNCVSFIGPLPTTSRGNSYALTVMDHYTKFLNLVSVQSKDGALAGKALISVFERLGPPKQLLADQDAEFCNAVNAELGLSPFTDMCMVPDCHPQIRGLLMRVKRTVRERLTKVCHDGHEWDEVLMDVAYSINTQKQASTGFSPFFLMFARHPRPILEMEIVSVEDGFVLPEVTEEQVAAFVTSRQEMMGRVHQQVQRNQQLAQQKNRRARKGKSKE